MSYFMKDKSQDIVEKSQERIKYISFEIEEIFFNKDE